MHSLSKCNSMYSNSCEFGVKIQICVCATVRLLTLPLQVNVSDLFVWLCIWVYVLCHGCA